MAALGLSTSHGRDQGASDPMSHKAKDENLFIQRKLFDSSKSQVEKYRELIIGKSGLLPLLKYELIILLSSWVPGALGLFLRSRLYPLLLGGVGKRVIFGTNVVLRHPHKIYLGDNVAIDDNCVLDAKGTDNKGVVIGNGVFIGRNSILYCKNGDIFIGDKTNISFNCEIFSANFVKVGDRVQIAAYSYLNGGSHSFARTDVPVLEQERSGKGVVVEDNAWLGAGVKVLDGVTIGRDAIVGAGAVVNHDLPAFSISGGLPARVIEMRDQP
jgi:acetyltransferase-like isoleucine patch superfamily enzyme